MSKQKNTLLSIYLIDNPFFKSINQGLGKQFAIKFAKQDFNLVLIARNQQKLQNVAQELKKDYNIEIKIVIADFQNSQQQDFFDNIKEQIRNLDVSILVNNVGIDNLDLFTDHSEQQIMNLITINCIPVSILSKVVISNMLKRQKKSAIINIGSFAGVIPTMYFSVYSATKAYINFLTNCLAAENPNLDIMVLNPNEVSTNMTYNKPPDAMTILPQDCVQAALRDLGKEEETDGHWNHKLQAALYKTFPQWLYRFAAKHIVMPQFFQIKNNAKKSEEKKKN